MNRYYEIALSILARSIFFGESPFIWYQKKKFGFGTVALRAFIYGTHWSL